MKVIGAVAEDDTVAIEAVSHGELHNGRTYTNEYHAVMRFKDGKIHEVREYGDTLHVFHVWVRD